ncbi:MAG: hypothetical protein NG747_12705 [Candidatus Brocadia sp.]|nr:hypothetical protein [Candidatus Brocadia sp.]
MADACDSLLSERLYRKVPDKESARAELMKFSGIYFDPVIVETLIADISNSR